MLIQSLLKTFKASSRLFSSTINQPNLALKQTLDAHVAEGLRLLREKKSKEAKIPLIKAAEISSQLYETNSKEHSALLNSLGRHFELSEDLETALGFYLKAHSVDKVVSSNDEELLAAHSNRIGAILADLGDLDKAEEYLSSIQTSIENSSNIELKAAYFGNFGHIKMRLGDQDSGLQNFLKAKNLQLQIDPKDEMLIKYLQSIGMCYWVKGEFQQAKQNFLEALDFLTIDSEKYCFGLVDIYSHLAYLHNDMKLFDESYKYFEHAIETFESSSIPDKKEKILEFIKNIVDAIKAGGDFDQTSKYVELYLNYARKAFGENTRQTAEGYNLFASIWMKRKGYKEALEYAEKAINICKYLQENHFDLFHCFNMFALIFHKMGELEAAEKFLAQSTEILKKHPDPRMDTNHQHNLALLCRDQGKFVEAEAHMLVHLKGVREEFGENHPATASSHLNLGHIYRASKNFSKAKDSYTQALSIFDTTLGRDHLNTSDCLEYLGEACRLSSTFEEAIKMHQEALRIRVKILGADHSSLHIPYFNLASSYLQLGDLSQALNFAQKRLKILNQVWGPDHLHVAGNFSFVAEIYIAQGDKSKALQALEESLRILRIEGNEKAVGEMEKRILEVRG